MRGSTPFMGTPRLDHDDRPDPDRRIERGPEMELVRRVGTTFGGDDAPEDWCAHAVLI
jgi:hypothetical protein